MSNDELLTIFDNAKAVKKVDFTHRYNSSDIEEFLAKIRTLESLEELYLSANSLTNLPIDIFYLSVLEALDLSGNKITELPSEIKLLRNLQTLDIWDNKLTSLPSEIGELPILRLFTVGKNQITSLPSKIGQLINLKILDISENQITSLPEELGKLTNLEYLGAGNNALKYLPASIGELKNLRTLDVSGNNLTNLPIELQFLRELKELDVRNNPLPIPPEIINKTDDPKSILNYYFSVVNQNNKPLNETKLLIVGQGSVGKTSLINRLLKNQYNPKENKTEGIDIYKFSFRAKENLYKINVWDFGGQEIMHATHQFFLTKRSLYLLVLDARLTQEENRVEYWLKIIQSFGGESPVLIVGNKTDQHPLDIDRTGLQKKYPNIVDILETSAATGTGIDALKATIAKQVDTLPHVRDLLPETWFMVKSKLEELGRDKNYLTQDEYLGLCGTNNVIDETSQYTLIGFLHDLGVVLHFQDDPRLEALGILNPQWVTNGVYKILNSHELFQNQGTLTLPTLNRILNLPDYPSNKRLFIVDMMKKFELCYDIEPDKSFLIPDLLPKDEIYTGEWDDALAFQYHYNVLPSSIITRFIVRMNTFIYKNTIWRSGVVLKYGNNTALVRADIEEKKIYIWVAGKQDTRRDLLAMIRGEFDAIHKTIVKIEVTEKVPVPNVPEATPIDLTFLQRAASEGRESLPVQVGNQIIDLIVKELLSKIQTDSGRNININIGGNFDGNLTVGDGNQSIKDSYNKIVAAKINPDLMQTLKQLTEAVSTMTQDIPKEQAAEVTDNLGRLVDEAIKPKPNKRWYSVSIEGLIKAAENLDKLGEPVINLSKKVLSLLTAGVIS